MPRVSQQYAEQWLESDIRHGEDSYRRRKDPTLVYRVPFCEQCGRLTQFLFRGVVTDKATRYELVGKRRKPKAIGVVDVEREGMVCQRCRPPSDLEILEMGSKQ